MADQAAEPQQQAAPKTKAHHIWNDTEDIAILKQYRFYEPWKLPSYKRGQFWRKISDDVAKLNLFVSERAVRDRLKIVMDRFNKDNPRDEWKTGHADGFSPKEVLLLEICKLDEEAARKEREEEGKKTKIDER